MKSIFFMFLGEVLMIYGENYFAKHNSAMGIMSQIILLMMMVIGSLSLLYAYKVGYEEFDNIRIVGAISVGSIIIVEPLCSWFLFYELPTKGAIAGFVLGVVGILTATFRK